MQPDEEDRFEPILRRARELPSRSEQAQLLTDACGDDLELRGRIEQSLAIRSAMATTLAEQCDSLTQGGAASAMLKIGLDEQPGTSIGGYKLLEPIGEGGFGTVWRVEQREPVTRQVALKIIKLGMDTKEVMARFEAERQALAMMEHPNIASVYDAGATGSGRPYFVMELVKGIPITQFCDDQRLDIRARLTIFSDVCAAVNHAHQKGIIHRDLKPSNVLVTLDGDRPIPKVIDFGIAKATQDRLTDQTLFTRAGQFIGTPAYMSPEQAATGGIDIDTRSDIYSLGVLLYECLTGWPPLEAGRLREAGYDEIRRVIREDDPPRPSARLISSTEESRSRVAATRQTDARKLSRLLKGDLDWIVLKAMEKDRARRYETANALMLDIQRFLADEDVLATPPSTAYRIKKLARRHGRLLAASAAVTLALVAGTFVSLWQANEARESRDLANERLSDLKAGEEETRTAKEAAERTVDFLIRAFESADSRTSAAAVLGRAESLVTEQFQDEPRTKTRLLVAIADANAALGLKEKAALLREEAVVLAEELLPGADDFIFDEQLKLSRDLEQFQRGRAEDLARQLLEEARAAYGEGHPRTLDCRLHIGILSLHRLGIDRTPENVAAAERAIQDAYKACLMHRGPRHGKTLAALDQLALLRREQGDWEEMMKIYSQLLEIRSAEENPSITFYEQLFFMSDYYSGQGESAKAEELGRRALEGYRKALGDTNPSTSTMRQHLGWILVGSNKHAEAGTLFARNLEIAKGQPEDPVALAVAEATLGHFSLNRGRPDEAIAYFRKSLELTGQASGETNPETVSQMENLMRAQIQLSEQGDASELDEAASLAQKIYEVRLARRDSDVAAREPAKLSLGKIRRLQGRLSESEVLLREAVRIRAVQPGGNPEALHQLVMTLVALEDYKAAAGLQEKLYDLNSTGRSQALDGLRLGILKSLEGDRAAQIRVFDELRAMGSAHSEDGLALGQSAAVVLLSPPSDGSGSIEQASEMAERAFRLAPGYPNSIFAAAADLQSGRFEEALHRLSDPLESPHWKVRCPALAWAAVAHHRLGNSEEAEQIWAECEEEWRDVAKLGNWSDSVLDARLIVEICMQEARETLAP